MSEAHSTSFHTPRNELSGQAHWVLGSCHCTFSFSCPIPSGQIRRLCFLLCRWAHHHPILPPHPSGHRSVPEKRGLTLPLQHWVLGTAKSKGARGMQDTVGTCSLLVTQCNSRDGSWIPRSVSKPGLCLHLEPGQGGKQLVAALAASENR